MSNKLPQMKTWTEPKQKLYPKIGKKAKAIEQNPCILPAQEYAAYDNYIATMYGESAYAKTSWYPKEYPTTTKWLPTATWTLAAAEAMKKKYEEDFMSMFKQWFEVTYPKSFTADSQVIEKLKERNGLPMDTA